LQGLLLADGVQQQQCAHGIRSFCNGASHLRWTSVEMLLLMKQNSLYEGDSAICLGLHCPCAVDLPHF
jgi:hypothetical protein